MTGSNMPTTAVRFQSMAGAAGGTRKVATDLNAQLNQLDSYLKPLVANWTGDAAQSYQQLKAQWTRSAEALSAILRQLAGALNATHTTYSTTEQKNTQLWQG